MPDLYTLEARVAPFVVAFLPLVIGIAVLAGEPVLPSGLVGTIGLAMLYSVFGDLGRERGKRLEPGLYRSWGGGRSTAALRCRAGENPDVATLRARRLRAEALLRAEPLPSEADELGDPQAADAVYDRAVKAMLQKTRGNPTVENANRRYGFARNSLGLKPIALVVGLLGLALCLLKLDWLRSGIGEDAYAAGGLALVLFLLYWQLFGVTSQFARRQNERLAEALYDAVLSLELDIKPRHRLVRGP